MRYWHAPAVNYERQPNYFRYGAERRSTFSPSGMMFPCPTPLLANGLTFGLDHCTLPCKVISALLVALSMASWAMMGMKLYFLRQSRLANRNFEATYQVSAHPLAIFQSGEHIDRAPFYHIYYSAAREMAHQLVGIDFPDRTFATRLQGAGRITPSQMGSVHRVMERSVAEAALWFESRMGLVALGLSVAPFLGLLGTVWGVLDTFASLADNQEPTVQLMAPGISGALVSTVVGLLVAVPTMFGYNLLVGNIRSMIVRLDNYACDLSASFDRHFVDHRAGADELPSLGSLGSPDLPSFAGSAANPPIRAKDIISRTPSASTP